MLPWLTYCILILFCATARVWYMSFILSIDFWENTYKNNTANHRSFQLFLVVYVLYIINKFLGKIPMHRIPQFTMSVSTFFLKYMSLCYQYIFCTFLSRYSTFFNANLHLFIEHHLTANQSVYI